MKASAVINAEARVWVRGLAQAPIRLYQCTLSPILGGQCRFTPSCSQYALEAIRAHGALKGWWLALRRLARCHPFCHSGYDPVPPAPLRPSGEKADVSAANAG